MTSKNVSLKSFLSVESMVAFLKIFYKPYFKLLFSFNQTIHFFPGPYQPHFRKISQRQHFIDFTERVGISRRRIYQHIQGKKSSGGRIGSRRIHDMIPNQQGPTGIEHTMYFPEKFNVLHGTVLVNNSG